MKNFVCFGLRVKFCLYFTQTRTLQCSDRQDG